MKNEIAESIAALDAFHAMLDRDAAEEADLDDAVAKALFEGSSWQFNGMTFAEFKRNAVRLISL